MAFFLPPPGLGGRAAAAAGSALMLSACLIQAGGASLPLDGDVVATAEETFCERRVPGPTRDTARSTLGELCNLSPRTIAQGGDMQQLVAHAWLTRARLQGPADLTLVNGGGVRTDFPGEDAFEAAAARVTLGEARMVLPFRNRLLRLTLTGEQLHNALEDGLDYLVTTPGVTGAYPYMAGLRFDVDLGAERGARLSKLQVKDANGQWSSLEPGATLRLVTSSFLAGGGDGYASLAALLPSQREELELDEVEALIAHIQALGRLKRLPASHYSTQSFKE